MTKKKFCFLVCFSARHFNSDTVTCALLTATSQTLLFELYSLVTALFLPYREPGPDPGIS